MNDERLRPFRLIAVRAPGHLEATRQLFGDYAASLPVDLSYQGFDGELSDLPGSYAPPDGDLLLALNQGEEAIGCVGLRPIGGGRCEMKRLFVAPAARSSGLGRALAEAVIAVARERGYAELVLDTLGTMESAIRLYERLGFERIDPYYSPTPPDTVFMRLVL